MPFLGYNASSMELTPKAQALELIKQASDILLLTHEHPDGDAVGSVLGMRLALKKLGKNATAAFLGRRRDFSFLSGFEEVASTKLAAAGDVVISIDTRETGEDLQLGYKKLPEQKKIQIVITPPSGVLLPEDVVVEPSGPKFDVVIILDTSKKELLGGIDKDFPNLFNETPTVVIDHHASNDYYGKINWVDMTAASTAEMLVAFVEALGRGEPLIDEEIATCLLTGIITDTGFFQNLNTTPKSLTVAAQMVAAGARHQEIIDKIRTKSLATLRVWGRALTRVKINQTDRYVWTEVTSSDLEEASAEPGDDSGLIDELLKTVADVDFAMVLSQRGPVTEGNLRSINKEFDVAALARSLDGGGHKAAAGFQIVGKLEEKRDEILQKISAFQPQHQSSRGAVIED